jgi:hypothetical protein
MINKEAQITALADFISEVENLNNQEAEGDVVKTIKYLG